MFAEIWPAPRFFLYLKELSFADIWVQGGPVPMRPASNFLSDRRAGVMTPDEVKQREVFGLTPDQEVGLGGIFENADFTNVTYRTKDQVSEIQFGRVRNQLENSHILCFSRVWSGDLCRKLECVAAVEIVDWEKLISSIRDQTGLKVEGSTVEYTRGNNREHFLKHIDDAWQAEFRIAAFGGDTSTDLWVNVPNGVAIPVDLNGAADGAPTHWTDFPLHHYDVGEAIAADSRKGMAPPSDWGGPPGRTARERYPHLFSTNLLKLVGPVRFPQR